MSNGHFCEYMNTPVFSRTCKCCEFLDYDDDGDLYCLRPKEEEEEE